MNQDPIEYRFLDMDNEKLYTDYQEFLKILRDRSGRALIRAIPSQEYGQCLYAAGVKHNEFGESFSEREAIQLCQKLSEVTNGT